MVSNSGETCHPCTSHYLVQACGGIILISRPTFMDIYPYFQANTTFKLPSSTHTHTYTHKLYIYIYILLCMSAQEHVTSTTRGKWQNSDIWHTSGCLMVDVPCLDHLWGGQKDYLDVGQVRCFHEETSRKTTFLEGRYKGE